MNSLNLSRQGFVVSILSLTLFVSSCGVRPDRDAPQGVGNANLTAPPSTVGEASSTPADPTVVPAASNPAPAVDNSVPAAPVSIPAEANAAVSTAPTTPVVTPAPTVTPVPTTSIATTPVVDWAYVNSKIISTNCMKCHAAPRNSGGVNLETYASTKAALDLVANAVLVEASMPPRKPLTADLTAILKQWIDAGAPETAAP